MKLSNYVLCDNSVSQSVPTTDCSNKQIRRKMLTRLIQVLVLFVLVVPILFFNVSCEDAKVKKGKAFVKNLTQEQLDKCRMDITQKKWDIDTLNEKIKGEKENNTNEKFRESNIKEYEEMLQRTQESLKRLKKDEQELMEQLEKL